MDQLDMDLLSEDEASALKETPPIGDEPEPTSDEEKVEKKEPSSPEKIEEPVKEPAQEPAPVKEGEKPPEEPVKEPVKEPEKAPAIDGIIAKDGKNFIPFSVLEEERAKRQEEATKRQQLEAEVAELRKPKPSEVKTEPVPKKEEPKPAFDFDAAAENFARKTYASETDAVDAAKSLVKTLREGILAELKGTATEAAKSTTIEAEFDREVERIRSANPWVSADPDTEEALFSHAYGLMQKRAIAPDDLKGMVKAAEDAVAWGKAKFRIDEPKIDIKTEIEKALKVEREKITKEIMAKFNIKESEDAVTLANVRNLSPDVTSKFDEIEKKEGIDFEEAFGLLTPEERDAYLKRTA